MRYKAFVSLVFLSFSLLAMTLGAQTPGEGLSVPAPAKEGPALTGGASPYRQDHHFEIRDLDPGRHRFSLVLVLDLRPGFHTALQEDFLWLRFEPMPGIKAGKTVLSPPDKKILDAPVWEHEGTISLPLELDAAAWSAMESRGISLQVQTSWQICDDQGQCFLPETAYFAIDLKGNPPGLTVRGAGGNSAPAWGNPGKGLPGEAIGQSGGNQGTSGPGSDVPGLLLMLLFAFLGGLILNVMPCVLPVLSLKVLSLMEKPGQEPEGKTRLGTSRLKGLAGSAGMVATMLALGGLVLALRAGGQAAGWGFQFQNPHFVVILVLVVLVLGMSMMGTWQLRLPSRGPGPARGAASGGSKTSRGLGRSFADGVLMVVMATPCSAPFLGSAMGFALAAPPVSAMACFLFLGLGLALPYFLLAWFPRLRGFMPKPGAWMDTFKTVLSFMLLGTAAWLSGISISQLGPDSAGGFLGLLTGVAFAFWIFGQSQTRWGAMAWILRGIALASLLISLVLFYPLNSGTAAAGYQAGPAAGTASVDTGSPGKTGGTTLNRPDASFTRGGVVWQVFSPQAVVAAQMRGKPVFLDFGAAWCITCGVNEKGILSDPSALESLASRGTEFFQGDYTLADPVILAWMQDWGRAAVPFYQVLKPDGRGQVLPELLGRADLDKAAAWLDDNNS